jgi:hypothetical protein
LRPDRVGEERMAGMRGDLKVHYNWGLEPMALTSGYARPEELNWEQWGKEGEGVKHFM